MMNSLQSSQSVRVSARKPRDQVVFTSSKHFTMAEGSGWNLGVGGLRWRVVVVAVEDQGQGVGQEEG